MILPDLGGNKKGDGTMGFGRRETLFRGRSPRSGAWAYGVFVPGGDGSGHILCAGGSGAVEVDPETVGEWTGIHDGAGNKVFEGDLVRAAGIPRAVVKWERAGYVLRDGPAWSAPLGNFLDLAGNLVGEVIGNAYGWADPSGADVLAWLREKAAAVEGGLAHVPVTADDLPMLRAALRLLEDSGHGPRGAGGTMAREGVIVDDCGRTDVQPPQHAADGTDLA